VNQETLGGHGEPCGECGAPLASDQRYCLNCGARRSDPRVDYRRYMQRSDGAAPAQAAEAAPGSPGGEEPPKQQRDYAPLAAVAGIAVLGLMLLVGVLIGKGDNSTVSTPPPVVVKGSSEESGSSPESGGSSGNGGAGGSAKKGSAKHKGASKEASGSAPVEASDESLNQLETESGEDYVEESKKIPDEVVTPGKPPPIDKSKPPGGGEGGGVVIK
jgi:hypothetical protein